MALPTLHLVYLVPGAATRVGRLYEKLSQALPLFRPHYRSSDPQNISWPVPVHAPFSITLNLLLALRKHYRVKLYDWTERVGVRLGKDDIFLFHPRPDFNSASSGDTLWTRADPDNVILRTLEANAEGRRVLLMPYTHDDHAGWLDPVLSTSSGELIAICGRYWTDSWNESPYKESIKRLLQVNMAIDARSYPQVKERFNKPGNRKFLYIGHTSPYKNTAQLEAIAGAYPHFKGAHIGYGTVQGWHKLADQVALTPDYMTKLAAEYDIFVTTSRADAQATTILEQICFGLAVACTPQTGYQQASITELSCHDTALNVSRLVELQNMSEEELKARAIINRMIVERDHSWEQFGARILGFLLNEDSFGVSK